MKGNGLVMGKERKDSLKKYACMEKCSGSQEILHPAEERRLFHRKSLREWLLFSFVFIILFCIFYHKTLLSGFDLIAGDDGDARFNILIAEHWIQFFKGELHFGETRFFYPFRNAMGFSDLSLPLAVMEIPFRMLGMDMFRA